MPPPFTPSLLSSGIQFLNNTCSTVVFSATLLSVFFFHTHPFCPSLFLFAVGNALVGKALKRLLAEQRPAGSRKRKRERETSLGMPSSHANALSFHAMYLTLATYALTSGAAGAGAGAGGSSGSYVSHGSPLVASASVCAALYLYTLSVCYARVHYTHDHTSEQIAAGLVLGSVNAVLAWTCLYDCFAGMYSSFMLHALALCTWS
jgi:dolichyldiphosphatase